jgi:hypothetical protein
MGHSDSHAIAGQSLDPALLHPAGGVGDDFMAGVKLNAKARVRQHLDYEAFELHKLFLCHYQRFERRP